MFKGELALVTGAASNIGRGIALALAGEGAELILTDINDDGLQTLAGEIQGQGGSCRSVVADLASRDGWKKVLDELADQVPDMLVHSACPQRHETDLIMEVSEETYDAMVNTNARSGFMLARAVAGLMKAAGKPGRILFMTSLHAHTPRNLPHYSGSKAAMTMIMKELARQLGPDGIRVNAIAPGAVPGGGFATSEDSFQPKRKIPLGRFGTPEDIAGPALALLSDRFSRYVTGTTVVVDGGLQLFSWIDAPDLEG